MTSNFKQDSNDYQKTRLFHMTRLQALVAIVTVILMFSSLMTRSIWGVSTMAAELDSDTKLVAILSQRVETLETKQTQLQQLDNVIQDLNGNIKTLTDEVDAMRNDWQDLWKNYSIPRKR